MLVQKLNCNFLKHLDIGDLKVTKLSSGSQSHHHLFESNCNI